MKIKKILISQPQPEGDRSPYADLVKQFNLDLTFKNLIKIERISAKEFRQQRINIPDYTALIFTSRHAVDHFFALAEDMRLQVSEQMKYFCTSETVALYLQKYVHYRKRKIFFAKAQINELIDLIKKHRDEKYIFICTENYQNDIPLMLNNNKVTYVCAPIYRTVPEDLTGININDYQMVVFFSPFGVESIKKNFPDFNQGDQIFGAFGEGTAKAIINNGYKLHVMAPNEKFASMVPALQDFLLKNKK
ncbi:MAG TPA: uroporphyrinogen-III synthase [Bacteroidales bacterium]|nr:uroporphyrinogen-III synthase [Bacteroidales bacterium]